MIEFIPLLSVRPVADWSAEEYHAYVRSLFKRHGPKVRSPKVKPPFTYSVNKKGTLLIRFNRTPAWISLAEMTEIAEKTGLSLEAIRNRVVARGASISP